MELFNSTGFEIGDQVWVELEGIKYFGKVVKVDDSMDRIKVDNNEQTKNEVVDWFHKKFWSK